MANVKKNLYYITRIIFCYIVKRNSGMIKFFNKAIQISKKALHKLQKMK